MRCPVLSLLYSMQHEPSSFVLCFFFLPCSPRVILSELLFPGLDCPVGLDLRQFDPSRQLLMHRVPHLSVSCRVQVDSVDVKVVFFPAAEQAVKIYAFDVRIRLALFSEKPDHDLGVLQRQFGRSCFATVAQGTHLQLGHVDGRWGEEKQICLGKRAEQLGGVFFEGGQKLGLQHMVGVAWDHRVVGAQPQNDEHHLAGGLGKLQADPVDLVLKPHRVVAAQASVVDIGSAAEVVTQRRSESELCGLKRQLRQAVADANDFAVIEHDGWLVGWW